MDVFDQLTEGFPITGDVPAGGALRPKHFHPSATLANVLGSTIEHHQKVIDRVIRSAQCGDPKLSAEGFKKTMAELRDPYAPVPNNRHPSVPRPSLLGPFKSLDEVA